MATLDMDPLKKREQFAVSLRKKKKQQIIGEKRKRHAEIIGKCVGEMQLRQN